MSVYGILSIGTPTAPTNVSVVAYNGSALIVSWGPPYEGHLSVFSYTVSLSGEGCCKREKLVLRVGEKERGV